jgi:FtsP/CotA-like multicopper oxidase with cupredoxin domain
MYRFRCLDASISRIYEFKLMKGNYKAAKDLGYQGDDLQGQYRLTNSQQCMRWVQVANGGGWLPKPIVRDSFEIWPAMRREVVVDFRSYQDGSPTQDGEIIWWANVCKMPDGRMPTSPDPNYVVPMIKIVIDGNDIVMDARDKFKANPSGFANSSANAFVTTDGKINLNAGLRQQPDLQVVNYDSSGKGFLTGEKIPVEAAFVNGKPDPRLQKMIDQGRQFTLQRGGTTVIPNNPANDNEWGINGHSFDETINVLDQKNRETMPSQGIPEIWTIQNGGGGWVHPMHMHMEEHKILFRNGKPAATWQSNAAQQDPRHADDTGKDDVVLLDPSEGVMFYRNFRTFKGKYVAHCHNLAHEDHAMMFGWEIGPREYPL